VLLKFGPGSDYQLLLAYPPRLGARENYPLLPAAVANYLKHFNFLTPAAVTGRDTSLPDGKSSHTLTGVVQDFPVTQAALEDFSHQAADGLAHSSEQSVSGQDYPTVQAVSGQDYPTVQAVSGQDYPTAQAVSGQDYPTVQAVSGQDYPTAQAVSGQDYSTAQAVSGQDFSTAQAVSGQDYPTVQAISGQDYPIAQAVSGQDYTTAQAVSGQDYPVRDGRNYPVVLQASGRQDSRLQILANYSANPLAFLTGPAAQLFLRSSS
jgi:hypothetical protein